jgi:nitrogen fixation protein NifB
MNAVNPEIGAKVYSWVRFGSAVYRGTEAARILLARQTEAIRSLKEHDVTVKINTVIIPGINDTHAEDVAAYVAALGADVQNCIPLMHVDGTVFEHIASPDAASMQSLRFHTGEHIKQMSHCARCRADAVGLLGQENTAETERLLAEAAIIRTTKERPFIAVATMEGLFVNRHLGDATALWIFALENGIVTLKEQRPAPVPGSGDSRWEQLAETLQDCAAVLVSSCGQNPKKILAKNGISVLNVEGLISEAALPILEGRELPKALQVRVGSSCGAGVSCSGTGTGCM